MLKNMELWNTIRHALHVEKISKRESFKHFNLNFRTINKIYHNASLEQECQENFEKTSANQEKTIGEKRIPIIIPSMITTVDIIKDMDPMPMYNFIIPGGK
jgi:hypothetical protein